MIVNEYSKDGNVLVRMMEESGRSFCTLEYYENFKEDMWFSDFNVSEKFRNKGIGNESLSFAIQYAKDHGCKYLRLCVVKDSWMEKWYARNGFSSYCVYDGYTYMIKRF